MIDYSDDICSILGVKDLAHEFNKIGVCYYPDLQKFFARLRLNLKEIFNYEEKFSAYCCFRIWRTLSVRISTSLVD